MSDNYDIKVAVDARESEKGLKTFEGGLKRTTSALSAFDNAAKQAFSSLDRSSSKVSFTKLASEAAAFAASAQKMSTQLAGAARNIDTFASRTSRAFGNINKSVAQINFSKVTQDLYQFNLRLAGISGSAERAVGVMNKLGTSARNLQRALSFNISAGNRNFDTIGRQLGVFATQIQKLNGVKIDNSISRNLGALSGVLSALRVPPASAAQRIGALLRVIGNSKAIPASVAGGLGSISSAMASFKAPSASAVRNLQSLIQALQSGNASQITATVNALRRLNGINIGVPPGTAAQLRQLINLRNQANKGGNTHFALTGIGKASGELRGLENAFSATYQASTLLRTGLGALTLGSFVEGIYTSGIALNQFNRAVEAVATSENDVASDKKFIETLTHELPIGLETAMKTFSKFSVSARLSGESIEETQKIYKDFSTAFAVMHMGVSEQENAFLALEQMFNKGKIMAEELRRQLGQYLPGAFELLAQSMGKTPGQLNKMMANGEVSAKEIAKLGTLLTQIYGGQIPKALATSQAQMTFFESAWTRLKQTVFTSGFDSGLAAMFGELGKAMDSPSIQEAAKKIGGAFQEIFKYLGALGAMAIENWEPIAKVVAALAGLATLSGSVAVLRLLVSPFSMMASLAGGLASGIGSVVTGVRSLAAAYRAGTLASLGFTAASTGVVGLAIAAAAAIVIMGDALYQLYQAGGDVEEFKKRMAGQFGEIASSAAGLIGGLTKPLIDGVMSSADGSLKTHLDSINDKIKQSQDTMTKLSDSEMEATKKRRDQQKALADADANLSKSAQQLLDKADPIGKANEQYKKQIEIIDQLNKRFHEGKLNESLNDEQSAALKKRLEYETLAKRNPFAAEIRDMREEMDVLKFTGDQRTIENNLLQIKKKLLKEGKELSDQEADSLREVMKARLDLERGGSNGFQRFASGVKDLRESLIDLEKNGVEKLSDALADLSVGKGVDFAKMGQDMLRSFNKSMIDDFLKNAFKGFNGNSPLASMFGLKGPDANALDKAQKLADNQKQMTRNVAEMPVTAQNVTITAANLQNIPGSDVSKTSTQLKLPQEANAPGLTPNQFSAGNNVFGPSSTSFSDKVVSPQRSPSDSIGGAGGMLVPGTGNADAAMLAASTGGAISGKGNADFGGAFSPTTLNPGSHFTSGATSAATGVGGSVVPSAGGAGTGALGAINSAVGFAGKAGAQSLAYAPATDQGIGSGSGGFRDLSAQSAYRGKQMNPEDVKGIIFHHTGGGGTAEGVVNTLNQRHLGVQYVMERDGSVVRTLPEGMSAAQIKPSDNFKGAPSGLSNSNTIGIEMIAKNNADLTKAQIASAQQFYQQQRLLYPNAQPFGHGEVNPGHKEADEGMGAVTAIRSQQQVDTADITNAATQAAQPSALSQQSQQAIVNSVAAPQTADVSAQAAAQQAQTANFAAMGGSTGPNDIGGKQALSALSAKPGETLTAATGVGQSVVQGNNVMGSVMGFANMGMSMFGGMINSVLTPVSNTLESGLASMVSAGGGQTTGIGTNGKIIDAGGGNMFLQGPGGAQFMDSNTFAKLDAAKKKTLLAGLGIYRYGGFSGSPIERGSFAASAFTSAPHYQEGTPSAARAAGSPSVAGGGFPAVLHDNEAVIPLTRGREVPVRLTSEETNSTPQGRNTHITLNLHGVEDFTSFRKSRSQAKAELASAAQIASQRNN